MISVVICAYTEQRWADLRACVESLGRQTLPPHEVLLVVDYNEALAERVAAEMSTVTVVKNNGARGLSGARNTGVARASGDVIAFLDDDAAAAPDWLATLAQAYHDPAVVGVGGSIEPAWRRGRPAWFPREFDWVVGCTYRGMPQRAEAVRNFIGANMSFRREVFDRVGGFQEALGRTAGKLMGSEETELCIRALRAFPGRVLLYEPRAIVFHQVPEARARWRHFRARCYAEGMSKALVSHLVGAGAGLATERAYVVRTLPRAVVRYLGELARGDRYAAARVAATVAGLGITIAGYLAGQGRWQIAAAARRR